MSQYYRNRSDEDEPTPIIWPRKNYAMSNVHVSIGRAVILTVNGIGYQEVRTHLNNLHEEVYQGSVYERGTFSTDKKTWEVGLVEISQRGTAASLETERALSYFKPDVLLYIGIAIGMQDVQLGDVVSTTHVYAYESGKSAATFEAEPAVWSVSYNVEQRARAEARRKNWLYRVTAPSSGNPPNVMFAPIVAGENAYASTRSKLRSFVHSHYNDAVAIEMEGYGVLTSAHAHRSINPLVVCGISELIRNDRRREREENTTQWRRVAAEHASAFAFEVLAKLLDNMPFANPQRPAQEPILWYGHMQHVWAELASLPRLGDVADIHRGIEYAVALEEIEDKHVSDVPHEGFARGLRQITDGFEPYIARSSTYLNMNPELMRSESYYACKLPWDKPKVIANAARISGDRWLIAGAVDDEGLVCTQQFYGIWATGVVPLEVIAALLNSPIANAFIGAHLASRENQISVIQQIPIPKFKQSQIHLIVSLVREYIAYREQWRNELVNSRYFESSCRGLIRQIDVEILDAYNLPMHLEREVMGYFQGYTRPGPVSRIQLKPSPTKRLYTSILRIEAVRSVGGDKVVDAVVISWNPHLVIQLPISLFPRDLREKLDRDVRLFAKVNIAAKEVEDLIFEDIELAPEPEINDRFA